MTSLRTVLTRIRELFRGRELDRDLDDELRAHVDFLIDDGVRRGLTPAAARAAALRALGGLDQTKEAVRDRRGFRSVETFLLNLRYAARLLAKSPGFTTAAVMTLALGIGANTAIFSIVDTALIRPLPYAAPEQLVSIWELLGTGAEQRRAVVSPADYHDYRRARSAIGMAAYAAIPATLTDRGEPVRIFGEEVSASYFDVLSVPPATGRPLLAADFEDGREHVVVLSHGLWLDRFGGSTEAIGQSVVLNDVRYEIVGVMPKGFTGISEFRQQAAIQFWIPAMYEPGVLSRRTEHLVHVVARLPPGASMVPLHEELRAMARGFEGLPTASSLDVGMAPLHDDVARDVRALLLFLLAAVGLILLLACLNVASLLIVRSLGRRHEIAIRFALGASRSRVAGELVTQGLLLSALGAVAGCALAMVLKNVIVSLAPMSIPRLLEVSIDARVLIFAAVIAVATGIAFSVLPAWRLARTHPNEALSAGTRIVANTWAIRSRRLLVVAEVAVSMLLLISAALMIRSLATLNGVDLGFRTENVLTANVPLPPTRYPTPASTYAFFDDLAARVAAMPGVRAVTFANRVPLRSGWTSGLIIDPLDGPPLAAMSGQNAGFQAVSRSYFETLGIRLVRGRLFEPTDREGTLPVAVVNEAFAPALLGGSDPIGRQLRRFPKAPAITVVGVVANIRRHGPRLPVEPEVYLSAAQTSLYPPRLSELAVRTDGDAASLAPAIRRAIWAIDAKQPVGVMRTLDETRALGEAAPRFQTFLLTVFAMLALALAAVGIYGVVAYAVSLRKAEIGLRLALGAESHRVLLWLMRGSLVPVLLGIAIGLTASVLVARGLQRFLFSISPLDPVSYVAAAAVLLAAGATATYIAARRATTIDAVTALR